MSLSMMARSAFAAVVVMGTMSSAAMAASSAEEVRSALVGNTFKGGMGGGIYNSYFAEDGTYEDASGGGNYEITEDGVCYPDTDYGCYAAEIDGNQLEWFKDGDSVGTGVIEEGNTLQ